MLLAADCLYLTDLTRGVARRIAEAAARGSTVLVTDSRFTHQEQLLRELALLDVEAYWEPRALPGGDADRDRAALLHLRGPDGREASDLSQLGRGTEARNRDVNWPADLATASVM